MEDETKKEIVVGASAVGAAAATGDAKATALTAVVGLIGLLFTAVMGRDAKKSSDLFERMANEDEDADAFLAQLEERIRAGDEEALIRLRALLRADLEAASPDASIPIAALGRVYLRAGCPAWAARGWLRVLSEVSSSELDALRQLASAVKAALETGMRIRKEPRFTGVTETGVSVFLGKATHTSGIPAGSLYLEVYPQPWRFGLSGDTIPAIVSEDSAHLFELLQVHAVASTRPDLIDHFKNQPLHSDTRPVVHLLPAAARALVASFNLRG